MIFVTIPSEPKVDNQAPQRVKKTGAMINFCDDTIVDHQMATDNVVCGDNTRVGVGSCGHVVPHGLGRFVFIADDCEKNV